MASIDSKQFDGTLKGAKDICAWAGEGNAVYGPSFAVQDDGPAAVNLTTTGQDEKGNEHPVYTDVPAESWVVRGPDGLVVFSDAQYKLAYSSK